MPALATAPVPSTDRRAAILDAALECFTERGVAATTIKDIRARSGASTGSIYHHFGSKERVAAALYVEALRRYQDGFVAALAAHPGAQEGVKAVVGFHLAWVARNPDLARFLQRGRPAAGEQELRELNRGFFTTVRAWSEPHVRTGALPGLPADLFYSILIGPCQEFSRQRLAGRTSTSLEAAARTLGEAAWRALEQLPQKEE